jgi:hypothetical protein
MYGAYFNAALDAAKRLDEHPDYKKAFTSFNQKLSAINMRLLIDFF